MSNILIWKWTVGVLLTMLMSAGSWAFIDTRTAIKDNASDLNKLTQVVTRMSEGLIVRVENADKLHAQLAATDEKLTVAINQLTIVVAKIQSRMENQK